MPGRKLTPGEARAWKAVTKRIRPRAESFDPDLETLESGPESTRTPRIRAIVPPESVNGTPSKRPARPADRGREKRVKRGQASIHGRLDLHGHTQASGQAALLDFVIRQRFDGARCVLIITGKGRSGEGILRRRFLDWLDSPQASEHVSGYAQAHQKHGGEGAFYVFLRRL